MSKAPPRARSRYPLARLVAVSLMLGVLITFVFAWASAVFSPFRGFNQPLVARGLSDQEWWSVLRHRTWCSEEIESSVMIRALNYKEHAAERPIPAWTGIEPPPTLGSWPNNYFQVASSHGFPMPALMFRFVNTGGTKQNAVAGPTFTGISLEPDKSGFYRPRALPLLPRWPGFALDVLFWSLVAAVLYWALFRARGYLRLRGGRCPACGYSRAGLPDPLGPCPECGATPAT